MDVATLVKNIISAFEDALSLVTRIRSQKERDSPTCLPAIDDLLDSLSVTPMVVRGYYDTDVKRFGGIYMTGDSVAREQLKDELINLQMTVISGLRSVMLDDKDPDYDAIQFASADCRTNVVACLASLSQRMSRAARGMGSPGKLHIYDQIPSRAVQRSNSHSTNSSEPPKNIPMTPPESDTEYLGEAGTITAQQRHNLMAHAPDMNGADGMHTLSPSGIFPPTQDSSAFVYQRPPTVPPYRPLESPQPPQDQASAPNRARDSSVSTNTSSSRQHSMYQTQSNQSACGSSDDGNNWGYFGPPPTEQSRTGPWSEMTAATLGKSRISPPNTTPINRKPISSPRLGSVVHSPTSIPPPYQRHSIPEDVGKEVYCPPPLSIPSRPRPGSYSNSAYSNTDTVQRNNSVSHRASVVSPGGAILSPVSTLQRNDSLFRSSGTLSLPTEKNLQGFCKGAFRLQIGLEKKAFGIANRPLGYSAMIQYWKCDKCNFEGTCSTIVAPGGKKKEVVFDPTIRDHDGIRFKWVFLAKCHVPLKQIPEGRRDGLYGGFSCIFCCAEASQRGWPTPSTNFNPEQASVKSNKSNNSPNTNDMPVFGNIHGFMDHLQMHRQPENWPGVVMQERMKCIVGRAAPRGEDFEINLLPIPPETVWNEL